MSEGRPKPVTDHRRKTSRAPIDQAGSTNAISIDRYPGPTREDARL